MLGNQSILVLATGRLLNDRTATLQLLLTLRQHNLLGGSRLRGRRQGFNERLYYRVNFDFLFCLLCVFLFLLLVVEYLAGHEELRELFASG